MPRPPDPAAATPGSRLYETHLALAPLDAEGNPKPSWDRLSDEDREQWETLAWAEDV